MSTLLWKILRLSPVLLGASLLFAGSAYAKEGAIAQRAAPKAIANCQRTLERIGEGLTLLQSSALAAEAFRFMNLRHHIIAHIHARGTIDAL